MTIQILDAAMKIPAVRKMLFRAGIFPSVHDESADDFAGVFNGKEMTFGELNATFKDHYTQSCGKMDKTTASTQPTAAAIRSASTSE